ncbi:hypothetical protein M8C21_003919, partial [Ambrosia artemisiifolia]
CWPLFGGLYSLFVKGFCLVTFISGLIVVVVVKDTAALLWDPRIDDNKAGIGGRPEGNVDAFHLEKRAPMCPACWLCVLRPGIGLPGAAAVSTHQRKRLDIICFLLLPLVVLPTLAFT